MMFHKWKINKGMRKLKIINPNKLETNVSIPGVSIGLQLGDIIRIKDDTNKILNNQIFFIDYIDTTKIKLINILLNAI